MTQKVPFKALAFSFTDRAHGRMTVRMKHLEGEEAPAAAAGDPYLLHIEQGPAERTVVKFDKGASLDTASGLCTQLLEAGVFSWDETFPDDPTVGPSRWMLNIVLEPGVFEVHVRGGSMYPQGFDAMMEAFYGLGLPRPEEAGSQRQGFSGMPFAGAGGLGAFNPAALQGLFEQMQRMMDSSGAGGAGLEEFQTVMRDIQENPQRMQELMRSEFRSMPAEQRNAMLDMLAATGLATRDWWERFFLG